MGKGDRSRELQSWDSTIKLTTPLAAIGYDGEQDQYDSNNNNDDDATHAAAMGRIPESDLRNRKIFSAKG